jgi:polar amino acid transport system substrate-binding protein
MKRITITLVALVLAAAVFSTLGSAAPGGKLAVAAGPAAKPKLPPKPKRSKLPATVRQRGHWVIGVKCDYPPFGYVAANGKNDGYDVEVARRFAQLAFGSKAQVELVCVTTPSRIPTLQSGRVDIIISTLTWTKARTEVIAYSIPYYNAGGRLLVPNNSQIRSLRDLGSRKVVTTRGALYATWVRNCFKNSSLLEVDSPALQ